MKIGFCGLGLMGAPMVRRLLAAGHQVTVWNRTPDKAASLFGPDALVAQTPAQLAQGCDVVLLCLFDAQAVEQVVFGADGLVKGKAMRYLVDHSSIPPEKTIQLAQRLAADQGAVWVDAPVSGGVGGAQQGTLAIMAGGPEDAIQQLTPLMLSYGQRVTRMGDVGTGQVSKLCNQTIVTSTIAAIGEAVALAQASGVDAAQLSNALAGGWADSVLLQIFVPRMTAPPPSKTMATINTMLKDLDTVAALAQQHRVPMPVSSATQQAYRQAGALALGENDVSQLIRLYRGQP
ncbi:MAG: NAD(P)-dependent oxidoreductase [Burkholderiaceae bacterium]|nr:NAD(P)-dependent oxidoreductase [Burkholderiaceae bacterium]